MSDVLSGALVLLALALLFLPKAIKLLSNRPLRRREIREGKSTLEDVYFPFLLIAIAIIGVLIKSC